MPALRTFQIRTSPQLSIGSHRCSHLTHVTKAFADDLLDYALGNDYGPQSPRCTSNLMAVIIGTQSFRQHWRLQHSSGINHNAPSYRAEDGTHPRTN